MVDKLDLGSSAFGVRVRLPSPALEWLPFGGYSSFWAKGVHSPQPRYCSAAPGGGIAPNGRGETPAPTSAVPFEPSHRSALRHGRWCGLRSFGAPGARTRSTGRRSALNFSEGSPCQRAGRDPAPTPLGSPACRQRTSRATGA